MIVRPRENCVRLISQHDHARAAGTIARNWAGCDSLPAPPAAMKDEVMFAVDNHDVGWCRPDAAPRLDEMTRLPYSFFGITADKAVEIWTEGIEFCASFTPFSGFLVSLHFSDLAAGGSRGAPPEVARFLDGFIKAEAQRRERLAPLIGAERRAAADASSALLRICDTLSLLACRAPEITPPGDAIHPLAETAFRVRTLRADDLEMSPWPFPADSLEIRMPGLVMPGDRFASEKELAEAWPMAEPAVFSSVLTRLPEEGGEARG